MTHIAIIEIEPSWCAVYVNGELFNEGHYNKLNRFIVNAVNRADEACTIQRGQFTPENEWDSPDSIEQVIETYPITDSILEGLNQQ